MSPLSMTAEKQVLKKKCLDIVKSAPPLPSEIKQCCVYEEKDGQRVYLDSYIPFIGDRYGQAVKILFYGTAQALSDHNKKYREEYIANPDLAIERLRVREAGTLNIDVGPIASGIVPALAGVLLWQESGIWKEDLANVLQYMAVANFYRFSMWDSKRRDFHPENLDDPLREKYTKFMFDNYIKPEITILKPDYIVVFGETPYQVISEYLTEKKLSTKVFRIYDTVWLLRSPKLLEKWDKEAVSLSDKIEKLINIYCEYIKRKAPYTHFRSRGKQIKIYLKHYLNDKGVKRGA